MLIFQEYLILICRTFAYLWLLALLFFIIKFIITKSEQDRIKRNMIIVKLVSRLLYEYFSIPLLLVLNKVMHEYYILFFVTIKIFEIGILLFYSGTPFIFFQNQAVYSWPINRIKKST